MFLSQELDRLGAEREGSDIAILRAAPSGIAAYNIQGKTIHSLFNFSPKSKEYSTLSQSGRTSLQAAFKDIRYLLIDEKSMVGLKMLSWIHLRCGEIWPERVDLPFAGLNIILCGDFYQLPPVAAKPLYSKPRTAQPARINVHEENGMRLYRHFNRTVTLSVVMRQQGEDEEAQRFRTALSHLRQNTVTTEDYNLLSQRVQAALPPDEVQLFQDALHIYATKEEVRERNYQRLRDLNVPVLISHATHQGHKAKKASTDEAGNLQSTLYLAIGAKVMLTQNVWTEQGLVNGATGVVHDIIWDEGVTSPREEPPLAVLIHFEEYQGPDFIMDGDKKLVPIFRATSEFLVNREVCRRTQFPLTLAYAITIHKSQGLTVDKAVLNLFKKDFAPGLTYVATSRVKRLRGLMFLEPFPIARLKAQSSDLTQAREEDRVTREKEEARHAVRSHQTITNNTNSDRVISTFHLVWS
jgi:ATP-dependent exoDNAse (exonuclease V) alpha subunit